MRNPITRKAIHQTRCRHPRVTAKPLSREVLAASSRRASKDADTTACGRPSRRRARARPLRMTFAFLFRTRFHKISRARFPVGQDLFCINESLTLDSAKKTDSNRCDSEAAWGCFRKGVSKRHCEGGHGMARAHAASACVQSDSIKGLAQSIAKPAYHRLLIAEPALRRAVPVLIIAFLVTICIGAFVQVVDQGRIKRAAMKRDLAALADILAERLDHIGAVRPDRAVSVERLQRMLPDFIPSWGVASGRHVLVRSADGHILARVPIDAEPGDVDGVLDAIGAAQLLALPGQPGGVADMILANGASALATARPVRALPGQVIVIQQRTELLWGSDAALSVTLSATTGFVVLILG